MKTLELGKISDVGNAIQDRVAEAFGVPEAAPAAFQPPNDYDLLMAGLPSVVTHPRLPGSRIVPIAPNMAALSRSCGKVFGLTIGHNLLPAVITDRSSAQAVHVTYLASEIDRLDPVNPKLTDLQKSLLQKITVLQHRFTGTKAADSRAVGAEFGHQQLGMASLLRPALLHGGHAVHGWAESAQGIAGAVTDPEVATIYDVILERGPRQVREVSRLLITGVLIDHPAFHEVADYEMPDTPQVFAVGLGAIAIESQLNRTQSTVQQSFMDNLEQL